jgi:hypothetical protein
MKKTLSSLLLTSLIFGNILPVHAISIGDNMVTSLVWEVIWSDQNSLKYPSWSEFEKIKSIIDTYLTKKEDRYYGIQWKTKPNYTPVIEKELKFLILSTYEWHADFYKKLFSYDGRYYVLAEDKESVKDILQRVPRAQHMDISSMLGDNSSMSDTFIDASFGVDFSEQDGSSDLKSAVENKLKEVMTDKCVETTRHTDCYRNKLSNKYLPTPEEFWKKTIYLKRESVKIWDIQDQIEYRVYGTIQKSSKQRPSPSDFEKLFIEYNVDINAQQKDIFVANPNEITLQPIIDSINANREIGTSEKFVLKRGVNQFMDDSKQEVFYPEDATYTLEYKSKSYTHEDALKEVESKQNKVEKKDYKKLMNGAKAENIPEIFKRIPNDSVSLYIKNPQNLLSILDQPSSGLQLGGIDSSKKIKEYMSKWLEIENFSQIQKHLKHESAIVLTNLDPTTPEVTFIISEKDRDALSGDNKTSIIKQQDGYIYVSSSQAVVDTIAGLKSSDSLSEADDFHYVWWKKSAKIQDAFVFVGDRFFEKLTTLDTFIKHYRKIQDYKHLTSLQELTWAYKKAYNRDAKDFDEIIQLLSKSWDVSITSESVKDYSIQNGIVSHKNIGTLARTNAISDANYDLNTITRKELDDYKYSVLKYRDIWRASLDPMGIIINQYKDGVSIDFFMTPIPEFPDDEANMIFKHFQDVTKDQLDFIRDVNVRSGMASMVFGFDPKKLKAKIDKPEGQVEKMLAMGYKESQTEVFGKDKNVDILSMIGGEFAVGVGSVDEDVMEFDAEKADAFFAVQVNSPEQWEELINLVRERILKEIEHEGWMLAQLAKMLAKPSIEEYRGSKIHYIDDIAVPFVGTMGLSYGYAKNFVYFAVNRDTIRRAIDTALDGDVEKANIVNNSQTSTGIIFGAMLNGSKLNETVNTIAKRNSGILYIGAGELSSSATDMISALTSEYYQSYERNMLLGKKDIPFQEKIGIVQLTGKDGTMSLKILPQEAHFSSGSIATQWSEFAPKIDASYTTGDGVDLLKFLEKDNTFISELAVFAFVSIFNNTEHTNTIFHNTLFTLNLGKDEIGFELRMFDGEKQQKSTIWKLLSGDNNVMMVIWIIILILLGTGGWFLVMRSRRRKMNEGIANSLSIVTPVTTEMNPVYVQPTVQSVIENTPTPPELPQDILAQPEVMQKQDDNIIRS